MQQYTVPTPLSNKLRIIIKTKVTLLLENYHIMNSVLSICNVVRLAQYTEFHSVPSVLTDSWHECCHQFPDRKQWHGKVTWHVCGPVTPTCQQDMSWAIIPCQHDISVALLHQYVSIPWVLLHQPVNMTWHVCGSFDQNANMTWHVRGPIILTYQHDLTCLWHSYTNMSTYVLGCYTMSTWHDTSVALLH